MLPRGERGLGSWTSPSWGSLLSKILGCVYLGLKHEEFWKHLGQSPFWNHCVLSSRHLPGYLGLLFGSGVGKVPGLEKSNVVYIFSFWKVTSHRQEMKVKSGDSVISQQKCAKVQRAVYLGTTCLPASHKPGAALICRPLSTGLDSGGWTLGSQRERRIHRTWFPAPPLEERFVHSASSFR